MNIIFHNIAHTGDFLFSKSFIKQFCEINNDLNISYLANYNSFLFSDITNLKIITPNKENSYTDTEFNGNYDPLQNIVITNTLYDNYIKIFNNKFENNNFTIINNNIYIKLWIGDCNNKLLTQQLECDIVNCNNYYNYIIKNINSIYNLNINLIENIDLLPIIPFTNIDEFLSFRKDKIIIFYYNYNPNSQQNINANHEENIKKLSNNFNNYIICCAIKPIYNASNVISIENFGYIKEPSCENIAKAYYCAMNSNIVISFDIGACFYYLNQNFNKDFKGYWFHISLYNSYFNKLNQYLNNNNVIYSNNIDNLLILIKK